MSNILDRKISRKDFIKNTALGAAGAAAALALSPGNLVSASEVTFSDNLVEGAVIGPTAPDSTTSLWVDTGDVRDEAVAKYHDGFDWHDLIAKRAIKLNTARSVRVNLASEASPQFDGTSDIVPGVTGTLPVSHGGTGKTENTLNSALVGNAGGAIKNIPSRNGAFYSPSDGSEPRFGTLPVGQGGSGAVTHVANSVLVGNGTGAFKNIRSLSGALYSETTDGVPKFGTLPVAHGGSGRESYTVNAVLLGGGQDSLSRELPLKEEATADGAFYATSANGQPQFGTLPIAQGGTGAKTAAEARSNLGLGQSTNELEVSHGGTGRNSNIVNAVLLGNGEGSLKNVETLNGAFYASSNGGLPQFGTLPVAQGGTGKTSHEANSVLVGNNGNGLKNIGSNNGALYAVAPGGQPVFGTLPVPQGGTGRTGNTVNAILVGGGQDALHNELPVKNIATDSGAFYAISLNSEPRFGTLPVAQGGTGATTAADARTNLGIKARNVPMTGYQKAAASSDVNTSDSVSSAIGKIEYKLDTQTHGQITTDGKIGDTADLAVYTTTRGEITAGSLETQSPDTTYVHATEFISDVSQDSRGKISAVKKVLPAAIYSPENISSVSASVGTEDRYAREDHVHKISLETGDNNGQVKIAGANVAVRGLGSAAFINADTAASGNTVVTRDGNGFIYGVYYNQSSGQENDLAGEGSNFIFANDDGWHRKMSVARARQILGLGSSAYVDADVNNTGSTIMRRSAEGYVFATHYNMSVEEQSWAADGNSNIIYCNADGYFRKASLGKVKEILGLGSAAYTDTSAYVPQSWIPCALNIGASGQLQYFNGSSWVNATAVWG